MASLCVAPVMRIGMLPQPAGVLNRSSMRSGLTSSFTASRSVASSSSCSLAGISLRPCVFRLPLLQRGGLVQVRAKVAKGCTKRNKSKKSIARVSGFRARMSTTDGRNVLKRRRAKGRKRLVPASNPSSGKYA